MRNAIPIIFLHIIFLLCSLHSYSQNERIDSLKKALAIEKEDTNKVNTLNELSAALDHDRNGAMQYAKDALSLAQKINFKNGEGRAFYQMGEAEIGSNYIGVHGNINEALGYFNNAVDIFKTTNDQIAIAETYEAIAETYANASQNYPEAEKYFYDALRIYEKVGDKNKLASISLDLGLSYTKKGNDSAGFRILENSLNTYKETNDSTMIAAANITIGLAYYYKSKNEDALRNFNNALNIYVAMGKRAVDFGIPWSKGNIANVYIDQGEVAFQAGNKKLALEKQEVALALIKERLKMEDAGNMSHRETYIQMGNCYKDLSDLSSGKEKTNMLLQSQRSYELSLQLGKQTNNKNLLSNSYYAISTINSALGNFKDAYYNYGMHITYRDSLFNEESTRKTLQTQMQYDFDKKESVAKAEQDKKDADAKRIKNQQYFIISALGIIVLAVLIIALIQFRNNKQKQKTNKVLETTLINLRSAQSQLIQSEKMASLGELTAGIAHEIQNPLNFVNNFSEVNKDLLLEMNEEIQKGNYDEVKAIAKDVTDNEEKISHHGKRADAIVKGMLQHSRSSTGVKEPTDINALADEYLRLSYQGLRAKDKSFNSKLNTDLDPAIGKINIIPQDIGRVLLNLYNNAFYAVNEKMKLPAKDLSGFQNLTGPGNFEPTVAVSTKRSVNNISITVSDNGGGIPQKVIDKIFQPFFTTKPTGQGTGLGLSLSYDIIRSHGGEINVNSQEGEFTSVTIILPV